MIDPETARQAADPRPPESITEEEWAALSPPLHVSWGPGPHPLDTELMDYTELVAFEWSQGDGNGFASALCGDVTGVRFQAHLAECGMCRLHSWRLSGAADE